VHAEPVLALILLFPSSDDARSDESPTYLRPEETQQLFFLSQIGELGNACGTIAMIHAISNNTEHGLLRDHAILQSFLQESRKIHSPVERGHFLAGHKEIQRLHDAGAQEGRSRTESAHEEENVQYHFISFLHFQGKLVELDGCKPAPVNHGTTTAESFFKHAADVVKSKYFDSFGGAIQFALMALTPS